MKLWEEVLVKKLASFYTKIVVLDLDNTINVLPSTAQWSLLFPSWIELRRQTKGKGYMPFSPSPCI